MTPTLRERVERWLVLEIDVAASVQKHWTVLSMVMRDVVPPVPI
ncbi:hypothetical protein ACTOB_006561 [Actinoplanes oblitus]|uniref:Uncharacterized protein n=1 Tax=Actinoplanes oblitus TaxID=3040509 RepID=A0ABY8WBT1_9ACTN|nr:hypothetical protein [Actinoplanes oblitus]WIM94533.1 hypothetical protein ACTOB_006561 [Actinoplanes oblitus]